MYNLQKGRIDFLLDSFEKGKNQTKPSLDLLKFIVRDDIKKIALQQFYSFFNAGNAPKYLIMDSSSEMADYKFVSAKNKECFFFAYFSDVKRNSGTDLLSSGLLNIDASLMGLYLRFFAAIRSKYPDIPIIYIHYPSKFEKRQSLLKRHHNLRKLIRQVSHKLDNFHIIDIPDDKVEMQDSSDSLYHFTASVYSYISKEISVLIKDE